MTKQRKQPAVGAAKVQDDRFIYRFAAVILIELFIMVLLHNVQTYYGYVDYMDAIKSVSGWAAIACLVLGAVLIAALVATGKRLIGAIGGLLIVLGLCAGAISLFYIDGITMSYALMVLAGVLVLAYGIYHSEFLLLVGLAGMAGICFFGLRRFMGAAVMNSYTLPLMLVLAVAIAVTLVLTVMAGDGKVKLGKWSFSVWQKKLSRSVLYLSCLVWAALLVLSCLIGAAFAMYCVFVSLVVIFVLAVWYTIQLM